MHRYLNPADIQKSANFSQGVEVTTPLRWLSIAGQVARDQNGAIPEGIEAQAEQTWSNVCAVLKEAGMDAHDLVEVNVYLINRADNAGFDKIRSKFLGTAKPASTKIYISGLSDPRLLCEVQARAAKAL
jgi:enamine deaminase RidA (YjgF/YER057c/UK114 family)